VGAISPGIAGGGRIASMDQFVEKHASKIVGTLSCFDRMNSRAYLPIWSGYDMFDLLRRRGAQPTGYKCFLLEQAERLKARALADLENKLHHTGPEEMPARVLLGLGTNPGSIRRRPDSTAAAASATNRKDRLRMAAPCSPSGCFRGTFRPGRARSGTRRRRAFASRIGSHRSGTSGRPQPAPLSRRGRSGAPTRHRSR
jgi:hypothetical protein